MEKTNKKITTKKEEIKTPIKWLIIFLMGLNILLSLSIILMFYQEHNLVENKITNIDTKINTIDNFFRSNFQQYGTNNTQTAQNKPTANVNSASDLNSIINNSVLYPALGPINSKITVIEFIDFQCPYCGLASGLVPWGDQYKTQYSDLYGSATKVENLAKEGKLRFIVVPMSFLGQESVYAAQAGLCANEQGKFFEMDNAIYSAQTQGENSGKYNKDKLEIIAQNIDGLNINSFKDCLENDKTLSQVQQIANTASKFASGTPTFYVNGNKVESSWIALQKAISQ